MRQQDTNENIHRTSSLSPSGARVTRAQQPGLQEDIYAGPEDLSVSDAAHLLEQSTAAASDKRPLPSAGADAASDLHANPREQASSISADKEVIACLTSSLYCPSLAWLYMSDFFLLLMHYNITTITAQGSTVAHSAVLDPPPELSSIRTSPPSASPQNSVALDDTGYPADLHSTSSASRSPSDATSVLSAQDNGVFPGNAALVNAHSTPGTNVAHQQILLPLKSLPLNPDLAPQLPTETSLAVAQLDSSKVEDSTESTDQSTADVAAAQMGSEPHRAGPGSPIQGSQPACRTDQSPETDANEQGSPHAGPEQAARHSQSPTASLMYLAHPQPDSDAWAGDATSSLGDSANAQTAAARSFSSPVAGSAGSCKPHEVSDSDTGTQPVPAASPAASVSPQDGSESETQPEATSGTSFAASASPKAAAEMGMGTEAVPGTSPSSSDSAQTQRQGSNAEASTRGVDDTESGSSPRKHRLAVQAGQSCHCCKYGSYQNLLNVACTHEITKDEVIYDCTRTHYE